MCTSCLNCIRTEKRIPAGSNIVLFSEPDMSKFERNTPELLSAALDHLAEQKGAQQDNFWSIGKSVGISYEHCVVLYSSYRAMLNFPTSRFTDWFHDLLASGGVYQIVV